MSKKAHYQKKKLYQEAKKCLIIKLTSYHKTYFTSFDSRFVFLLSAAPFHNYKQEIITTVQI